ncbi:MAG: hypothetical protein M3P27_11735 [Acidobacteriota bacterium]|nr:hypothetical protein [Acidobacteriota bacterium]
MTMRRILQVVVLLVCIAFAIAPASAENCLTTGDMDAATKSAIESTARQFYGYTAAGDVSSLRMSAIPSLQGNFGGIERSALASKDALAGSQPNIYSTYMLDATGGPATIDRAMFMCGVYNSADRIQFSIPNLPAARYALVIMEANGQKGPYWLSLILQQMNGGQQMASGWKLAGFYPKRRRVGSNGPGWYLTHARDYRAKGEMHNAYFYYVTARDLALPVSFMITRPVEKLDSEAQPIVPRDLPGDSPMTLAAGGKNYQITQIFPVQVGDGMNLVIKYKALTDVNDARSSFANNMELIKAFAQRYPEYRTAFTGYVARAVDASTGADYGTVLNMSEVK